MKKIYLLALGCCVQLSVIAQAVIKNTTPRKQHATVSHKTQPAVKWKHSGNKTTTVAKDDHAAYEGKPSQSNDGVNKNKQRNINANVPTNLAPVNGNNAK